MVLRGLWSCGLALVVTGCGPQTQRIVMKAENNSGQSGFAVLTALSPSSTRIDLDLAASNDPRPQPGHVHEGRCGEIGAIRAGLASVAPSPTKPERFVSSTEVSLGFEQLLSGTYAINVHDARDLSLYISCGDLTR
ncbi:MAG: hypothetical protein MUC96_21260 [Myxococcaceae bacterium]|jgi:hypothetical protein|nr:hypothetical protein [Myxococcaceae bacterium]